jgi:hypothetical protein
MIICPLLGPSPGNTSPKQQSVIALWYLLELIDDLLGFFSSKILKVIVAHGHESVGLGVQDSRFSVRGSLSWGLAAGP